MDLIVECIFSLLVEAPLDAVMESGAKRWIKTALVSLLVIPIAVLLVLVAIRAESVWMWSITAAVIAGFGLGIVRGHIRDWKTEE